MSSGAPRSTEFAPSSAAFAGPAERGAAAASGPGWAPGGGSCRPAGSNRLWRLGRWLPAAAIVDRWPGPRRSRFWRFHLHHVDAVAAAGRTGAWSFSKMAGACLIPHRSIVKRGLVASGSRALGGRARFGAGGGARRWPMPGGGRPRLLSPP